MTTIGWDIDDVTTPWYDTAHELCIEAGLVPQVEYSTIDPYTRGSVRRTGWLQPQTWHPWEEYGCTKEAWVAACEDAGRALYEAPPTLDALGGLMALYQQGYRVQFVTARGSFGKNAEQIQEWTADWFASHHLGLFGDLLFSKDKTIIRADYFLDDATHNVQALRDDGTAGYLLSRPWNQDSTLPRVGSCVEFAQTIITQEAA